MKKKKAAPAATAAPVLLTSIAVVALAGGTLMYAKMRSAPGTLPTPTYRSANAGGTPIVTTPAAPDQAETPTPAHSMRSATIYHVIMNEDGSHLEPIRTRLSESSGKSPETAAVAALDAMAKIKDTPLPAGTRALSVSFGDNGIATVDFNKAFKENFSGGDETEALVINAVTATLGQFSGVEKVRFTLEGEKMAQLGGTQDLSDPLAVPQTGNPAQQTAQRPHAGDDARQP